MAQTEAPLGTLLAALKPLLSCIAPTCAPMYAYVSYTYHITYATLHECTAIDDTSFICNRVANNGLTKNRPRSAGVRLPTTAAIAEIPQCLGLFPALESTA